MQGMTDKDFCGYHIRFFEVPISLDIFYGLYNRNASLEKGDIRNCIIKLVGENPLIMSGVGSTVYHYIIIHAL